MRYNTAMAQKYFTSEKAQANPKLKELGITLKNKSFFTDEDINDALFFLESLIKTPWREKILEQFKGNFSQQLFPTKSVTFELLIQMVRYVKILVHEKFTLETELFHREPYAEDAKQSVFGFAKETSSNDLNKHISDAILLLSLLQEARDTDFREISTEPPKPDEETPPTPTPPPTEEVTSVVTAGGLGGSGSTRDKDKKKKENEKEEEKKKKEEEEKDKKPSDEKLTNDLKTLAQADRQLRHEIFRIQSAITHQLAAVYGISESQYAAFEQEIGRHVSPIVYTHIQKLNGEELRKHLQQNVSIYIFNHSPLSKETPSFNTRFFLQDKLHIKNNLEENLLLKKSPNAHHR